MNANKFIAFMAVTILIACPIFAVCANTDDVNAEAKENAAMIEFKDLSKDKAEKVINLNYLGVLSMLYIASENTTSGNFSFEFTPSKVTDKSGVKKTWADNKMIEQRFMDLSYDYVLKIKALKQDVKLTLSDVSNLSGEGKDAIQNFITQKFNKDQVMEISGNYAMKMAVKYTNEYNMNQEAQYLLKDMIGEIAMKMTSKSIYKFSEKSIEVTNEGSEDISQNMNCDYSTGWVEVKDGDKYKQVPQTTKFNKLAMSVIVKQDGKDKKVNTNLDEMKKNTSVFGTKTMECTAQWVTVADNNDSNAGTISTKVNFKDIQYIADSLRDKTDDEIKKAVTDAGGTPTTDVKKFNEKYDAVKNDVNGGSSNSNNDMWIWIAVAVVVILIIAALAFWYFKYKKPSA